MSADAGVNELPEWLRYILDRSMKLALERLGRALPGELLWIDGRPEAGSIIRCGWADKRRLRKLVECLPKPARDYLLTGYQTALDDAQARNVGGCIFAMDLRDTGPSNLHVGYTTGTIPLPEKYKTHNRRMVEARRSGAIEFATAEWTMPDLASAN
jgi:hypothetical protein